MNPIVKATWIAALRSGEYKQAKSKLHRDDGGFCCLGVLCDLHAKIHGKQWEHRGTYYSYFGADGYLPNSVLAWAGLENNGSSVRIRESNLANLNDDGQSFERIAELIEAEL